MILIKQMVMSTYCLLKQENNVIVVSRFLDLLLYYLQVIVDVLYDIHLFRFWRW
uniref:Uncharacterized protein n=1 Tax=Rhizophora mucronata TaxID=61149 RepID=A0A2P2PJQ7_RHIMU